jgi:hypothetical protein
MAYYLDLSPDEHYPGQSHMLNVGWLSRDRPFARGPVPLAFADELRRMASEPVEITRGCHVCEFCEPPGDIIAAEPRYLEVWEMFRCGNGEIHVRGESSVVYCAPELVVHYVSEHQYRPPEEFIAAVLYQRGLRTRQFGALSA